MIFWNTPPSVLGPLPNVVSLAQIAVSHSPSQQVSPPRRKLRPLLPAKREEAKVQEDGQAHAEHDAHDYPEKASATQRGKLF